MKLSNLEGRAQRRILSNTAYSVGAVNNCATADGVLLLDKPIGLSSYRALRCVARLISAKKAGHTGTLDPLASGLLPLCFGEATKFSQALLAATKCYDATLTLGVCTTTGDADGDPLQTRPVNCDLPTIQRVLSHFRGNLLQVPPMYSALKRNGRPLYEYARAGRTLEREARPITIYALELIDAVLPTDAKSTSPHLNIRLKCSKGTYVRSLAQDMGEMLGCGAHLTALRRTAVGSLTLDDAVRLDTLEATDPAMRMRWLRPVDALLSSYSAMQLTAEFSRRFKYGQRLRLPTESIPELSSHIRVYNEAAQFLGTAHFIEGILVPERLVSHPTR